VDQWGVVVATLSGIAFFLAAIVLAEQAARTLTDPWLLDMLAWAAVQPTISEATG
jgi:hypothetical protein